MKSVSHILLSPALFILYPAGADINSIALAMAASVLIDIDHIQLIVQERAFSFSKVKALYRDIYKNYSDNASEAYKKVFYLFHKIEFNILLLILSAWYPPLLFIALGFIFHIICDILHHIYKGMPILRLFFLCSFLKARRSL